MHPDDSLFAVFDDLEQQAAGLHLAERDAEVGELALGEYAQVSLLARLHGAGSSTLRLRLCTGEFLRGRIRRVGADWLQVDDEHGASWLVPVAAVLTAAGLGERAVSEEALPITARLSMRSALRTLAAARRECVVELLSGDRVEGTLARVGQDFVEVRGLDGGGVEVVPLRALVTVRERR